MQEVCYDNTIELTLRHLKTTLGMEMLTTKTPQMARKELDCHLLAYNLIRALMGQAARRHGVDPLRLSVQGSRRFLDQFLSELVHAKKRQRAALLDILLELVAKQKLPLRPGRFEPRVRKRRPLPYPLMNKPRQLLRRKATA